ncbi:hypothetical protein [Pannonibacter indicus]|uniref:hypothetical protein n=1 Tax=Pannonibacter indicus TaxID=466044 RepID=UPI0039191399
MKNFNHLHQTGRPVITGTNGRITAGDFRDALASLPDHAEILLQTTPSGERLKISGFDQKGPETLLLMVDPED